MKTQFATPSTSNTSSTLFVPNRLGAKSEGSKAAPPIGASPWKTIQDKLDADRTAQDKPKLIRRPVDQRPISPQADRIKFDSADNRASNDDSKASSLRGRYKANSNDEGRIDNKDRTRGPVKDTKSRYEDDDELEADETSDKQSPARAHFSYGLVTEAPLEILATTDVAERAIGGNSEIPGLNGLANASEKNPQAENIEKIQSALSILESGVDASVGAGEGNQDLTGIGAGTSSDKTSGLDGIFNAIEALSKRHGVEGTPSATAEGKPSELGLFKQLDKLMSAYGAEVMHVNRSDKAHAELKSKGIRAAAMQMASEAGAEASSPGGLLEALGAEALTGTANATNDEGLLDPSTARLEVSGEGSTLSEHTTNNMLGIEQSSESSSNSHREGSSEPESNALDLLHAKDTKDANDTVKVKRTVGSEQNSIHGVDASLKDSFAASDVNTRPTQAAQGLQHHKVSPSAIMEQVREAIMKAPFVQGERSEMVLQLKPEELGKVELKIEVHKDSVIAKFDVASTVVKEVIESNLTDLKNSLKDKGFSDMSFDVNVSKENQGEASRHSSGFKRRRANRLNPLHGIEPAGYQKESLSKLIGETQFEHYA